MAQFRFSIRQLLALVVLAALLLLLLRLAQRSAGLAVGATVGGLAAVLLLTTNVFVYSVIRVVGQPWAVTAAHAKVADDEQRDESTV